MELNVSSIQFTPKASTQKTASTPFGKNAMLKTAAVDSFTPSNAVSFGASPIQLARASAKKASVSAFKQVMELINPTRAAEAVKGIRTNHAEEANLLRQLAHYKKIRVDYPDVDTSELVKMTQEALSELDKTDKSEFGAVTRALGLQTPKVASEKEARLFLESEISTKLQRLRTANEVKEFAAKMKEAGFVTNVTDFINRLYDFTKIRLAVKALVKEKPIA